MRLDQDTRPDGSETRAAKRIAIYSAGGALSGFVVTPFIIMVPNFRAALLSELRWSDFFAICSPFGPILWQELARDWIAFIFSPVLGALFGALTSVIANRFRHPVSVSVLWASAAATLNLAMNSSMPDANLHVRRIAIAVGLVAFIGGVYGFTLGCLGRLLEPRAAATTKRAASVEQHDSPQIHGRP